MRKPNFSKLLTKFTGDYIFVKFIARYYLSPDSFGYEIETNHGCCLVYEVDSIDSFAEIKEEIARIGEYRRFVPVKKPLIFEQATPVLASDYYSNPKDWETICLYANEKYNSYNFYFSFLVSGFQLRKKIDYDIYYPINYRLPTWNYIMSQLGVNACDRYDIDKPGRIAYDAGIINQPKLLQRTVIDLDDGVDYIIDRKSAKALANGEKFIILTRLYDKIPKTFTGRDVKKAIRSGEAFDQLDLK